MQLERELKAILGYLRPSRKKKKKPDGVGGGEIAQKVKASTA